MSATNPSYQAADPAFLRRPAGDRTWPGVNVTVATRTKPVGRPTRGSRLLRRRPQNVTQCAAPQAPVPSCAVTSGLVIAGAAGAETTLSGATSASCGSVSHSPALETS